MESRLRLYMALSDALRRGPCESLRQAAERMARTHARRHQGVIANRVLAAGDLTGEACWRALEHAARLL